jgi:hypothetical protein
MELVRLFRNVEATAYSRSLPDIRALTELLAK